MTRKLVLTGIATALGLFSFWMMFFHYAGVHQAPIVFNRISGEAVLGTPGLHFTPPWVFVSKIDTRPQRVCVTSAARTMACKLARFVPSGYEELIRREGFRYYWWDNRISFNLGYPEEYRGIRDLVRGYAFGKSKQNFVEVLEDLEE